jgi:hypothetical protein
MAEEDGGNGSEASSSQNATEETAASDDGTGTDEDSGGGGGGSANGSSSGATDILNSPAFLKRKLEVLKNDLEKAESDLVAALERAEVAKEEWAPQLEDLQREVSVVVENLVETS